MVSPHQSATADSRFRPPQSASSHVALPAIMQSGTVHQHRPDAAIWAARRTATPTSSGWGPSARSAKCRQRSAPDRPRRLGRIGGFHVGEQHEQCVGRARKCWAASTRIKVPGRDRRPRGRSIPRAASPSPTWRTSALTLASARPARPNFHPRDQPGPENVSATFQPPTTSRASSPRARTEVLPGSGGSGCASSARCREPEMGKPS